MFPRSTTRYCTAALSALALLCLGAGPAFGARPALASSVASAGEWPQFQGGAAHPGSAEGPEPPYRRAWSFPVAPVGEQSASAPVVSGDVAITVGPSDVFGIDLSTGKERWSVSRAAGPSTVPAIATVKGKDVVLFTEGSSGSDSRLRAVDVATQEPVWTAPVALGAQSHSGVTVDGDTAFVGDDLGHVCAVDIATGSMRWTATLVDGVQGPLAVAGGRVYVVPQGRLSLNATASPSPSVSPTLSPSPGAIGDVNRLSLVALSESTGEQSWMSLFPVGTFFTSLPLPVGQDVYVAVSDGGLSGQIIAVGAESGSERWTRRGIGPVWQTSTPTEVDGSLYLADARGGLWKFDAASGDRVFDFQFNEPIRRSSPVVVGNAVVIGLGDGRLAAVDTSTGHQIWESDTGPGLIGGIAASNDEVLASKGGREGGIPAFAPDPGGRLIDVISPSVPKPGQLLGNFAVAVVVVIAVLAIPLGLVHRRMAPPEFPGEGELRAGTEPEEEPEDEEPEEEPE